jgi:hypothetical protein
MKINGICTLRQKVVFKQVFMVFPDSGYLEISRYRKWKKSNQETGSARTGFPAVPAITAGGTD